ncbi:MAG: 1-acyl-sn-glycerol-3-phosphate acyltransferase [Paramuribaculum sp.]|nr:1-acyl-sn-glycerol-3-phosphate acyltransferase [Paramuribaculum sp.]MDE6488628.1 1-acyl-sn-glycerol-3-phosphate acyltransferase [Paramuribaculum sp.]
MNISKFLLRIFGWKVKITVPDYPKCIICVAPHTSNWDFIIGKLAYASVGRKAGFLMKSSWFFFPLGFLFKSIGGIPVVRGKKGYSLVEQLIAKFKSCDRLTLAITPEGTRARTSDWHTGFLRIAYATGVKIALGAIDFSKKEVTIAETFSPVGIIDEDMKQIKAYYKKYTGKYPEKFSTE